MDMKFHANWRLRSLHNVVEPHHTFGYLGAKPTGTGIVQVYSQGQNTLDSDGPRRCFGCQQAKPAGAEIVQVHSQGQFKGYFDACKQNNKLLVIEFTAAWCGPCRTIEPTLKALAADYTNVQFIKVDVDQLISVAVQFRAQALPAFILMKNGKEVDRVTGVKMEELQLKIAKNKN